MESEFVDGQCPVCGLVETHAPACSPLKARIFWIRMDRDHELAALAEVYVPRQRLLHDEYAAKCAAVWERYRQRIFELRASA